MRPTQCVGGLYLTATESLAPLPINIMIKKNFMAISNCGKWKRSSQIFRVVSGVFQQDFNGAKNSAVFEPRPEQFSRTWGFEAEAKDVTFEAKAKDVTFEAKAKDFKMCPRGQKLPRGLLLWFLITPKQSIFLFFFSKFFDWLGLFGFVENEKQLFWIEKLRGKF